MTGTWFPPPFFSCYRFLTRPQLARSYLYKKNTKLVTSTSSSGQLPQRLGRYVEWPIPFFSPLVPAKTETPASTLPHQNSQRISVPREQVPKKLKCEFSHANHQRAWGPRGFRREPNSQHLYFLKVCSQLSRNTQTLFCLLLFSP